MNDLRYEYRYQPLGYEIKNNNENNEPKKEEQQGQVLHLCLMQLKKF